MHCCTNLTRHQVGPLPPSKSLLLQTVWKKDSLLCYVIVVHVLLFTRINSLPKDFTELVVVIQQLFTMFAWADVILSYFSVNSILEKDVPTSHKSAENLTSIDFLNTRSFLNPKREDLQILMIIVLLYRGVFFISGVKMRWFKGRRPALK